MRKPRGNAFTCQYLEWHIHAVSDKRQSGTVLMNGLLTGLGAAVATASIASPALTGVAWANTVTAARPGWPTEYFTAQPQWWWCSKCSGFFYSSGGSPAGICPAGYAHNPYNSWMYETVYDHFSEASVQEGWRW